jgi:hypothetical protein
LPLVNAAIKPTVGSEEFEPDVSGEEAGSGYDSGRLRTR